MKGIGRVRTWQILLFIALSGFPFMWTWRGGSMQNPIIDLTTAICEHGRFTVDEFADNTMDVAYKDGHYYSGMPPCISFLALPVYGVAKLILAVEPSPVHRFLESAFCEGRSFERHILASKIGLGPVKIIPPIIFPWYEGLLLDIAYQAILIGLIFGLPMLIGRLRSHHRSLPKPRSLGGPDLV